MLCVVLDIWYMILIYEGQYTYILSDVVQLVHISNLKVVWQPHEMHKFTSVQKPRQGGIIKRERDLGYFFMLWDMKKWEVPELCMRNDGLFKWLIVNFFLIFPFKIFCEMRFSNEIETLLWPSIYCPLLSTLYDLEQFSATQDCWLTIKNDDKRAKSLPRSSTQCISENHVACRSKEKMGSTT